jgi:hypothetical protein
VASERLLMRRQLRGGEVAEIPSSYTLLREWISIRKAKA